MLPVIGVPITKRSWRSSYRTRLFQLLWMMFIGIGWVETAWIHITEDDEKGVLHMHPFDGGTDTNGHPAHGTYSRNQLVGPALNVTVLAGETALLACLAPHLGDKTVSWIRQKDLAILVSGRHVYTSDPRISFTHPQFSDLWGLQISPVRSSDEGSYQCQINTEPKMSRSVALIVLDQDLKDSPNMPPPPPFLMTDETTESARTLTLKILGPSERLVRQGSDVTLFCTAALQQPSSAIPGKNIELAWWQEGLKLNEKFSQGRYSMNQEFGTTAAAIHLHLYSVLSSDSGAYHCKIEPKILQLYSGKSTVVKEASITLNVINPFSTNCVSPLTSNYFFTCIISFFITFFITFTGNFMYIYSCRNDTCILLH